MHCVGKQHGHDYPHLPFSNSQCHDQTRSFNFSLQDTLDVSGISVCKTVPSSTFSHRCENSFAKCIKLKSIPQFLGQENMQFPMFF